MPPKIVPGGALPDTRPQAARDKDYSSDELNLAGAPVPFGHTKPTQLGATLYSQEYVGSCVPHGFYTQLEYEGILPPGGCSQLCAYRKRSFYPNAGSGAVDMYDKIRDGQKTNAFFPTPPGFTEAQATAMQYLVGEKLIKEFNYFDFKNYTLVPAAVASGKAVAIFIYATEEEWSQEYVTIKNPNLGILEAYVRHCVCIMPNGDFTENGKRWLAVQDSARFGGRHLRYVEYDEFFLKRAYYASQVFVKGTIPTPPPPPVVQKPLQYCEFGQSGAPVKNLQAYLIEHKFLEPQYLTGFYGALTAKAVLWFQLKNHEKFTVNIPMLLEWGGKYWGKQSISIIS